MVLILILMYFVFNILSDIIYDVVDKQGVKW